jgi:hypothetical protein
VVPNEIIFVFIPWYKYLVKWLVSQHLVNFCDTSSSEAGTGFRRSQVPVSAEVCTCKVLQIHNCWCTCLPCVLPPMCTSSLRVIVIKTLMMMSVDYIKQRNTHRLDHGALASPAGRVVLIKWLTGRNQGETCQQTRLNLYSRSAYSRDRSAET